MTNNQDFYKGEMVIYTSPEGTANIDVRLEAETLWLSQKMMAEIFDKDSDTIGLHLKNIYSEQELEETSTTEVFSVVQTEGKRQVTRRVKFYNLDAILSVGYRVNSKRGTQFRIWANRILKEHLVQGYTINEKRLKEKAAMLLYLVVKNHSFVDGNKRIAAAIFLHFLSRNDLLYRPDGNPIITSDALAALTLLIAVSKPEEKDTMIKIVISILNRGQV